eukprot:3126224-Pleurochrysis_carterae.AAC.1
MRVRAHRRRAGLRACAAAAARATTTEVESCSAPPAKHRIAFSPGQRGRGILGHWRAVAAKGMSSRRSRARAWRARWLIRESAAERVLRERVLLKDTLASIQPPHDH